MSRGKLCALGLGFFGLTLFLFGLLPPGFVKFCTMLSFSATSSVLFSAAILKEREAEKDYVSLEPRKASERELN